MSNTFTFIIRQPKPHFEFDNELRLQGMSKHCSLSRVSGPGKADTAELVDGIVFDCSTKFSLWPLIILFHVRLLSMKTNG